MLTVTVLLIALHFQDKADIMHNDKHNRALLEDFNKHVHGHIEFKKAVINLVNKSKLRYYRKHHATDEHHTLLEPNKILVMAPSGQGKTYTIDIAAKLMRFPLIKVDACTLAPGGTSSGINPTKLKGMIRSNAKELVNTSKDYYSVQGIIDQTVVFIDEIDKLAKPSDSSGRWSIHVQENLLTLLEDKEDFSGVSFIFAGAFTGIEKQQPKCTALGFMHDEKHTTNDVDWEEEIIKYGIIPELVGRLNGVYRLDPITKEGYEHILSNILLPAKQEEMVYYNCMDFDVTVEQREAMIKKAVDSGQGVRLLKRELNKLVQEVEFTYEDRKLMLEDKTKAEQQEAFDKLHYRYKNQGRS